MSLEQLSAVTGRVDESARLKDAGSGCQRPGQWGRGTARGSPRVLARRIFFCDTTARWVAHT